MLLIITVLLLLPLYDGLLLMLMVVILLAVATVNLDVVCEGDGIKGIELSSNVDVITVMLSEGIIEE